MTERIDEIVLDGALPKVFVGDNLPPSDIWLTKAVLKRGERYCIDAASGTGKTSLCSFLYGVRRDYVGTIAFGPDDIRGFKIARWCELRRSHLAYLPQELDMFGELSALDNVMLKNRLTDFRSEAEIRAMFERLEIDNRIATPAGRMSVGQRQRAALIRALCQPFDFILLDEPVSHLDERNNELCASMIADEAALRQAGVIFTSVGNRLALKGDVTVLKL